jgi:hypothetical protein
VRLTWRAHASWLPDHHPLISRLRRTHAKIRSITARIGRTPEHIDVSAVQWRGDARKVDALLASLYTGHDLKVFIRETVARGCRQARAAAQQPGLRKKMVVILEMTKGDVESGGRRSAIDAQSGAARSSPYCTRQQPAYIHAFRARQLHGVSICSGRTAILLRPAILAR